MASLTKHAVKEMLNLHNKGLLPKAKTGAQGVEFRRYVELLDEAS